MAGKNAVAKTVKSALQLYRNSFKICFMLSMFLAVVSECFKVYAMRFGLYEAVAQYLKAGTINESRITHNGLLVSIAILSVISVVVVYALIVCIGILQGQNREKCFQTGDFNNAWQCFRRHFWCFIGAFILNVFLWGLGSLLSLIGIWLVISFTFVLFPVVLAEGLGPFAGFRENLRRIRPHIAYVLQLGLVVMLLLLLKVFLYSLLTGLSGFDRIEFGVEHVLIIFVDALVLPFVLMLSVAAYIELNHSDDLPMSRK